MCVCCLASQHAKNSHQVDSAAGPAASYAAGDGSSRGQAGAVAAAARELRPVEIVGLYEEQKDRAEVLLWLLACTCCHGSEQSKLGPNMLLNFLPAYFCGQRRSVYAEGQ